VDVPSPMVAWGWRSRAGAVGPGCGSEVLGLRGGLARPGNAVLGGAGGSWLEGWPCHWPAGPRGSLVPVPSLAAPAPALLAEAAGPLGCLAWARLRIPESRAGDNQPLRLL